MTLDGFIIEEGYSDGSSGAAVYTHDGLITFINCIFRNNFSTWGGAVCSTTSSMDYIDCLFENNTGAFGGAYQSWGGTTDRFFNCDFIKNISLQNGGAITAQLNSEISLENCRFYENKAPLGGAIFIEQQGIVTCMNTIFNGNHADSGGAVFIDDPGKLYIHSSIMVQNRADQEGGGIYLSQGTVSLHNSILRDNMAMVGPPNIAGDTSTFTFGNCHLEQMRSGPGNMTGDPLFIDPDGPDNIPGNIDDDFHFLPGASALNTGDSLAIPLDLYDRNNNGDTTELFPFDLELNPRIRGGNLDRGPYESTEVLGIQGQLDQGIIVGNPYPNPSVSCFLDIELDRRQMVKDLPPRYEWKNGGSMVNETINAGTSHLKLEPRKTEIGLYFLEIRSANPITYRKWVIGE